MGNLLLFEGIHDFYTLLGFGCISMSNFKWCAGYTYGTACLSKIYNIFSAVHVWQLFWILYIWHMYHVYSTSKCMYIKCTCVYLLLICNYPIPHFDHAENEKRGSVSTTSIKYKVLKFKFRFQVNQKKQNTALQSWVCSAYSSMYFLNFCPNKLNN